MTTDLARAFDALHGKAHRYTLLWRYYDGEHPLIYSAERLKDVFGKTTTFIQNWSAVVVDAPLERIDLEGFSVSGDDAATDTLTMLLSETGLDLDAIDVHTAMLVTGEAFVFVWQAADGTPQAYYHDPRLCHAFYDDEDPSQMTYAAKWWIDPVTEKRHMNLYYTDRIEYYVSVKKAAHVQNAGNFIPSETDEHPAVAPNPYEQIPIFHFRANGRRLAGELTVSVISIQDAINKLFSDMMVTGEFGAFRQRWIISQADVGTLKNAPNEIWDIPAGDGTGEGTTVGEFSATDLRNYTEPTAELVKSISAISRTPLHFFVGSTGNLSGEALIALEAPLNKKATRYIKRVAPTWRAVAQFMLAIQGVAVDRTAIEPVFAPVETVQPMTQAAIRESSIRAGIPLETILRDEGWTQAQLDQLVVDQMAADASAQQSLASALMAQQRRFDQNNMEV